MNHFAAWKQQVNYPTLKGRATAFIPCLKTGDFPLRCQEKTVKGLFCDLPVSGRCPHIIAGVEKGTEEERGCYSAFSERSAGQF